LNGYKKSQEFMLEVKEAGRTEKIWWNNGLIVFETENKECSRCSKNSEEVKQYGTYYYCPLCFDEVQRGN
jgi:formamidopyrimidine-DNA glycosylase